MSHRFVGAFTVLWGLWPRVTGRAADKLQDETVGTVPFWLGAAWVAEFMESRLKAPSKASAHQDEVEMATWLETCTRAAALEKHGHDMSAYYVAGELDELAKMLRSRARENVGVARDRLSLWRRGTLYRTIASMCEADPQWMTAQRKSGFEGCVSLRERFWPTWAEWKRDGMVGAKIVGPVA